MNSYPQFAKFKAIKYLMKILLNLNPLPDELLIDVGGSGLGATGFGTFFFPFTFSQHCSKRSSQQILLLGHVP